MIVGLSLVVAWAMTISASFGGSSSQDHWYRITIRDSPCGYVHESIIHSEHGIRSESSERLRVDRGGSIVELRQATVFEEDLRGTPLRASVRVETGGDPVVHRYEFPDGMPVEQRLGVETVPVTNASNSEPWLTPSEVRAFLRARIGADARRITYRTIDPFARMTTVEIEMTRIGTEQHDVLGRSLVLSRWRMLSGGSAIVSEELRTEDGILVSSVADVGLGTMKIELVDRETALEALQAPPPELLDSTLLPVANMVGRTDGSVTAGYRVFFEMERPWDLPNSGAQHVRRLPSGELEVIIDAASGSAATAEEHADPGLLSTSAYIDIDDQALRDFFLDLQPTSSISTMEQCERLRLAVARRISNKTFGVAFGSASDAFRSRSGDCTEHAVLLAAGFRLAGLPSRVATGLVHAPAAGFEHGAFAWHMWTQVLIDGVWWDYDATRRNRFDAGHLLVSTSSLEGGTGERALSEMLLLLGRMRVEAICVDGRVLDQDDKNKEGERR